MDGIVGMAFQKAASDQMPTLIDTLYNHHAIAARIFSFYLDKDVYGDKSTLIIGPPDSKYYNGIIEYVDVISSNQGMWFVRLSDSLIGHWCLLFRMCCFG
jgi:hypothetical protein